MGMCLSASSPHAREDLGAPPSHSRWLSHGSAEVSPSRPAKSASLGPHNPTLASENPPESLKGPGRIADRGEQARWQGGKPNGTKSVRTTTGRYGRNASRFGG